MSAAHKTLPLPTYVKVTNLDNGRTVTLRVNDRGPFHSGRIIDLSYTAALKLDLLRGVRKVHVQRITHEQIRAGTWRRDAPSDGEAPVTAGRAAPTPVDGGGSTPATSSPGPRPADPQGRPEAIARHAASSVTATPPPAAAAEAASSIAPPAAPTVVQAEPSPAHTSAAKGFWVQLGVFRQATGAVDLQKQVERELDLLRPLLAIFNDRSTHRLQAGPFRTRAEAQGAAAQVRQAMKLVPVIVERR